MYIVAKGHSFTTPRGILGPGNEISEKDFSDKKAFLKRVQKGSIVAGKSTDQLAKEEAEAKITAGDKAAQAEAARRVKEREDAARKVQTAEAALKTAQDKLKAVQGAALAVKEKSETQFKAKIDGLEAAVRSAEDVVKAAVTETEKAKGDAKQEAEGRTQAAREALKAALNDLRIAREDADTPEYRAACAAVEKAEDDVVAAEANLEEAKEEAAKIP
ncbi:MAG: hypothetical protein LBK62_14445 [Treponema sp.]|jgi:hypothetical protein|nr:hypothetical protein [Treponema sp.]